MSGKVPVMAVHFLSELAAPIQGRQLQPELHPVPSSHSSSSAAL